MLKLTEETVTTIENLVKLKKPFKCRVGVHESQLVQELLFKNNITWSIKGGERELHGVGDGNLTIGYFLNDYCITRYVLPADEYNYLHWDVTEVIIKTEEVPQTYTNIKEVMEALLAGKVLLSSNGNAIYKLKDNKVLNKSATLGNAWTNSNLFPQYLVPSTEYIPPKEWYEQIPEEGVLCWVDDRKDSVLTSTAVIVAYLEITSYPFVSKSGSQWIYAKPLTQEEANKLIYKG